MIRCEVCRKFSGEPRQPKVGDMVDFTIERGNGRNRRISVRTGKLMLIKSDGYSVIYRQTVYHSDEVSCPDDPSPLTLAFVGMCDCVPLENSHA
ncbi:hypothetical protein [Erwinia sp. S38]|uniref:hypothetical protein n=1 Tax=Erwinia sp. S38 TaxID=2769338 RepID=UPI00190E20AD|nr:hypothetical protein [Erwinia sp. S38]MBK0003276.1 hypothetical protein [Erwinia sp. S38]